MKNLKFYSDIKFGMTNLHAFLIQPSYEISPMTVLFALHYFVVYLNIGKHSLTALLQLKTSPAACKEISMYLLLHRKMKYETANATQTSIFSGETVLNIISLSHGCTKKRHFMYFAEWYVS